MRTIVLLAVFFSTMLQSQVMNDAQVLRPKKAGAHISAVQSNGVISPVAGFGIGIFRGADIEVAGKKSPGLLYISINTEIILRYQPCISLSLGGHYETIASGADMTVNVSFPINRFSTLYTGVDADANYVNGNIKTPFWYFAGINTFFSRGFEGFLEIDPAIFSPTSIVLIGGVRCYF